MPQEDTTLLADPKVWISIISVVLATWSAFNSWRSRQIATRALAISESQEQRRRPQFGIYLANGFRRHLTNRQLFGFLISVSNPTDINNSIVKAELRVTYVLDGEIKNTCRVSHDPALAGTVSCSNVGTANVFSLPTRIDAHQTLAGWLVFALDHAIISERTIDSHTIILEDSHGVFSETEPLLVRDWTNETPKN